MRIDPALANSRVRHGRRARRAIARVRAVGCYGYIRVQHIPYTRSRGARRVAILSSTYEAPARPNVCGPFGGRPSCRPRDVVRVLLLLREAVPSAKPYGRARALAGKAGRGRRT